MLEQAGQNLDKVSGRYFLNSANTLNPMQIAPDTLPWLCGIFFSCTDQL